MKNKLLRSVFLLLISVLSVSANEEALMDFAYGYTLEFNKGKSVYETTIPLKVYETVTQPNLQDIRIFNSEGEVVPHQVITPEKKETKQSVHDTISLPFFPLTTTNTNEQIKDLKFKTSRDGSIIEFQQEATNLNYNSKTISNYIIDASKVKEPIQGLTVKFKKADRERYFFRIHVFGSDDLRNWQLLNNDAILASLEHQGEFLVRNHIPINKGKRKYYRIAWDAGSSNAKVSSIQASFGDIYSRENINLSWRKVEALEAKEKNSDYVYMLNTLAPVSRVRVHFGETNAIATVSLEGRNSRSEGWTHVATGALYSMEQKKSVIKEDTLFFPEKRFKQWRLKVVSNIAAMGTKAPTLEFGWTPEMIRFLARGSSPFTIAFGSTTVPALNEVNLNDSLFNNPGLAKIEKFETLGGESKLIKPKELPWKKWVLWSILIIGVIVLMKMALSLMKSIDEK